MVVGTCWNGVDFCLEWSLTRALCIVSAKDPHFIKVYSWGYKNTSPSNIAWIPVVSSTYCAFNWPPCTFCISNWKMSWKTRVQVISIKRWSINGKWLWLMDLNKSTINTWDPCSLVARHLVEIQWQQTHDLRSFFFVGKNVTTPMVVSPPLFVSWQSQTKLRPVFGRHWHHRSTSMKCATSKQLKAPDLTQSWGERRGWQQPRYSPCRTPELLEYENGGVFWWPGGGLFEEILSWDTSIIQRRSLYLWVASFVSILHGRATSSRAMKWWLAASLSSTSCVSTGFYQRQFQTKSIAFHFAQCNSIQFNLWNGIHFPEQIAPLAERNLFFRKSATGWCLKPPDRLVKLYPWAVSLHLLGRLVWNCVGWSDGPKS